MILIRDIPSFGTQYIIFLFINVWLLDTAAMFAGKKFGKHKLAPNISPKKTLEGALAGILTALPVSVLCREIFMKNIITLNEAVIFALIISVIAQFSDLAESLFKRDCNIKDSGNILPGHGGMLDRFDSYLFCAPLFYYAITILKG
jgi:phosphatidate cytidylyltransferase